jgi:hypothetical protein
MHHMVITQSSAALLKAHSPSPSTLYCYLRLHEQYSESCRLATRSDGDVDRRPAARTHDGETSS